MCSGSDRFGDGIGPGREATGDVTRADGAERWGDVSGTIVPANGAPGCDERFAGRGRSNPELDPPLARENMIIQWLRQRAGSMRGYLKYLVDSDLTMNESLRDIYSCSRSDLRLALALFIDFAHEQRLGPGELAPLMSDAHRDLLEAVCFVIGSAVSEAGADSESESGEGQAPSPLPTRDDCRRNVRLAGAA